MYVKLCINTLSYALFFCKIKPLPIKEKDDRYLFFFKVITMSGVIKYIVKVRRFSQVIFSITFPTSNTLEVNDFFIYKCFSSTSLEVNFFFLDTYMFYATNINPLLQRIVNQVDIGNNNR